MTLEATAAEVEIVPPADPPLDHELPAYQLWIMAIACGVSAANIYYNQPLLHDFAFYFKTTDQAAGSVAMAAQLGYGIGMFFFVPLGDLLERRRIVLALVGCCTLLLLTTAAARSLWMLVICQCLVGITAMSAQLLIPLAVDLTPPHRRGHTVGMLMAGLLAGILLARTVAGFIGDHLGWRAVYNISAGMMLLLGILLFFTLPHRKPAVSQSYGRLMHSMIELLTTQRQLWSASIISAISFGCFSLFWTSLTFYLLKHYGMGDTAAGNMGLVGLVGALAAPIAGKLSDKKGPAFTVAFALVSIAAAFALMWVWQVLIALVIAVLLLDLGVQSIQVAEQARVIALVPQARSRMNTLYMVARFAGGAAGSALAGWSWAHAGWSGVCGCAIAFTAIAILLHIPRFRNEPRTPNPPARPPLLDAALE